MNNVTKKEFDHFLSKINFADSHLDAKAIDIMNRLDTLFDSNKEVENPVDRLAELEEVILHHYLDQGYKLEKDQQDGDPTWAFSVYIESRYKDKRLGVHFYKNEKQDSKFYFNGKTTKEIYDSAIEHFKS